MKKDIPILKQSTIEKHKVQHPLNRCDYGVWTLDKPTPYKPEISALRLAREIIDALIYNEVPARYIKAAATAVIGALLSSPECNKFLVIRDRDKTSGPMIGIKFNPFMERVVEIINKEKI